MYLKRSIGLLFVTGSLLSILLAKQPVLAEGILLSNDVPLSRVQTLSSQDIRNDLDTLISTLANAYGGKNILPGNQYNELIQGINGLKVGPGGISSLDFCNQIADQTEKINDCHLTVHIEAITCRRQWPLANVGANSGFASANQTWSVMYKENKNKLVAVLSIKKMSPANSPEWNGFLETVQSLVMAGSPFIIDMRRNPGGDSTKGNEMARLLYGLEKNQSTPMPKKQTYRQRTPDAWALLANAFWLNMQSFSDNKQPVPGYLNDTYQSMVGFQKKSVAGLIPALEVEKFGTDPVDLSRAVTFPIYILVDRNCGSSCELTLEALENLPAVQTVGENTTGVVQYGNVGALYLPSSHIVVRMPTQGSKYDDGREVEKNGYAPRWKVQPGTDALEFTLSQFFL